MVAVDCEMCYTHTALELTRLTLVNENEQVCHVRDLGFVRWA